VKLIKTEKCCCYCALKLIMSPGGPESGLSE
jgi:hypothetical protein